MQTGDCVCPILPCFAHLPVTPTGTNRCPAACTRAIAASAAPASRIYDQTRPLYSVLSYLLKSSIRPLSIANAAVFPSTRTAWIIAANRWSWLNPALCRA